MNKIFSNISPVNFSEIKFSQKPIKIIKYIDNLVLRGISENSNNIRLDYGFFALPGSKKHGANFVKEALENGANLIISDLAGLQIIEKENFTVPILIFIEPRKILAELISYFFKNIPKKIVGITGTNGKTSIANYLNQIWEMLGYNSASIGTIGINGMITSKTEHTTPDAIKMRWYLNQLFDKGVEKVALEASSHGLVQDRLHGINISAGIFTNLSRDHFDYHKNFNSYFKAKAILFEKLVNQNGGAVINIDGFKSDKMLKIAQSRISKVLTVGAKKGADLRILSQSFHDQGQKIKFCWENSEFVIDLGLYGKFQAQNVLSALACINILEDEPSKKIEDLINYVSKLKTVPGRMEKVASKKNGAEIFVDFAHTPSALEAVLKSIRCHFLGDIYLVFGAGGNRDVGKRSIMGKIASKLSDHVFVTDDNPRFEKPSKIRSQILESCPNAIEIADRSEAILTAINLLKKGDALIIAGKGHENLQIYKDNQYPFNDAEEASFALQTLEDKF